MNFSSYLESKLLGATLMGSTYTAPTTIFAALFTAVNSNGSVVTEVLTPTGYIREQIIFGAPSAAATSNSTPCTWSTATTPWGGITGIGLYDAATAGNQLYWQALTTPQTIIAGNTFQIPSNQLNVFLSGNWSTYLRNAMLGVSLCGSPYSAVGSPAAALFTSLNSNGDSVVEVTTATGYSRTPIPFSAPTLVSGSYVAANSSAVSFSVATTPWGSLPYVGIYDSISLGNLLYYTAVSSPSTVTANNQVQFTAGSYTVGLS